MRVTVLILSLDEAPMLERSLPAALAQEPRPQVVVVDNACTDATASLADRHGARRIRLDTRRSYAAAINEGIAVTGGDDAVLLLNADCFLAPGFLAAALPHLGAPHVGVVAPKLVRVAGAQGSRALGQIDTAGMVIDRRRKNGLVGHGRPSHAYARGARVFGADGAAALYRRETLIDCALDDREVLDEDMELWASDADLAWRAQLLGWSAVYEPAAVAEHVRTYSPSTRAEMGEADRRLQFRNRYLMMLKNDTPAALARDLPWVAGYELAALGHVLLRERHLLEGYREAWALRHAARRRRRLIQGRRRRSAPLGIRAPA
ncbi:MAG TPA: glycosyltransferase [Solirubrobacteraceae bacterium]|nr:glycosyltransferase [Solirubrobacteraceae bacterium]